MSFDFSEVGRLAADLGQVPEHVGPNVRRAVEITARRIKDGAAASVQAGARSWRALPSAIDYDVTAGSDSVVASTLGLSSSVGAEIGYNRSRRQSAKLGNLREFGAPAEDLPPHNDLLHALEDNQGDFQHGLEIAIQGAEQAAGL